MTDYRTALRAKQAQEEITAAAGAKLRELTGGGPMGTTPEHVKKGRIYLAAKATYAAEFAKLREVNAAFVKDHGKRRDEERRSRR